ncbi:MAG: prepilin-type N-terminal cleavage/methylation domain-containing protein [bacterium]
MRRKTCPPDKSGSGPLHENVNCQLRMANCETNQTPHSGGGNRKSKTENSFTLVELVLVIVIIGIVTAIAVPKMGTVTDNIKLNNAVSKLIDDICYARHFAVDHHDTTWIVVDVSNNRYGIYKGNSPPDRELIVDPHTGIQTMTDFDDVNYKGVAISSADFGGSNEFYFDYWGIPSNSGTVVINDIKTISVVEGTGFVSISN